jgi:type II secretory pathway predicted ATPase ExeA
MYGSDSRLSQRPFVSVPQTDRYFPGTTIEEARRRLVRCIERAEGPALLIGPAGVGKSLLCQVLADQFESELAIVSLASARLCSRRALLQVILFELGLPYRDMEEGELRLSLIDRLASPIDDRAGMLLLVDEAHNMPFALLEEMRMITNLVRDGQPRVRLVLAGLPTLEERFANPKLECFNQRLAARCYLGALNRVETIQYIRAQIAASATDPDPDELLTADALEAVYHATDGVPRLINQLCDQALLSAGEAGVEKLSGATIEAAWSELQQLPTPWCGASPGSPTADAAVVEFGCLDDLPCDGDSAEIATPTAEGPCLPEATELDVVVEMTKDVAVDTTGDVAELNAVVDMTRDAGELDVAVDTTRDAGELDVAADMTGDVAERLEQIEQGLVELSVDSEDAVEFVPAGTIGLEEAAASPGCDPLGLATEPATPEAEMAVLEASVTGTGAEWTDINDAMTSTDDHMAGTDEEMTGENEEMIGTARTADSANGGEETDVVGGMNYNPFEESYDDEEVVIDQYSALACEVFRQQPRVVSKGDGMPLHLLRQVPCHDERPSLSLAEETLAEEAIEVDAPQDEVAHWLPAEPCCQSESDETVFSQGEATLAEVEGLIVSCQDDPRTDAPLIDLIVTPAAAVHTVDTVSDASATAVPEAEVSAGGGETECGETGDGDVLVIEDQDDETVGDEPAVTVTPVHAGQYSQLFARLRRA